jgi:hypothetical protein
MNLKDQYKRLFEGKVSSNDTRLIKEATPSGRRQAELEEDLMANIEASLDELIDLIVTEAHSIGSSFRTPGIMSRASKLIKDKLRRAKLL